MDAEITGTSDVVLSVAVAATNRVVEESLVVTVGGADVAVREVVDDHGVRLHRIDHAGPGRLDVTYAATVDGRAEPAPTEDIDLVRYLRPSRYCEADQLGAFARAEFAGLRGTDLVDGVAAWVRQRLIYLAGSSRPIDGAVATLLAGQGVCRDYAHLVVGLLRALDVPARLVSVYAPGLWPMDFHAVAEVHVGGGWYAVDATGLAPRSSMVRIATGRDAADTAFLTVTGDLVLMGGLEVGAVVDPDLPFDDITLPERLG